MIAFKTVTSRAILLPRANIDTDIIIPARYLKTITRSGLGVHAFESLRTSESPKNLIKNSNPIDSGLAGGAKIMIVGENFGCGSSREHAVWAIADLGIRAIFAPSFADIFRGNCKKNGVLAATLTKENYEKMSTAPLKMIDNDAVFTVDLMTKTVTFGNNSLPFDIADDVRLALLEGRDDISDTLDHIGDIKSFEENQKISQPWLYQPLKL